MNAISRKIIATVSTLKHSYLDTAVLDNMISMAPEHWVLPVEAARETKLGSFTWLYCANTDRWFLAHRVTGTLYEPDTGRVHCGGPNSPRIVGGLPQVPTKWVGMAIDSEVEQLEEV